MMNVEKDKAYEDQIERMKQKNQQLLEKFQASEEDRKRAEDHGSTIKKEQNVSLRMKPEDEPKLRNNRLMGPRPKSFHGNFYHDNQDNQFHNQSNDNRKTNKFRGTKFNEEAVAYQDYKHFQQTHTNKSFNNNNTRHFYRQSSHVNYSEEPNNQKPNYQEFNRSYNQSMRNRIPPRFAQNYPNNRISKDNDFHNQNHPIYDEFHNQHRMSKDNEFHNHHYPNAKIQRDEFHNSHHVNNRFFKENEFHNQHFSNAKSQREDFHNHQNSNIRVSKDNELHNQHYSNTRMPKDEFHNQGYTHPRGFKENDLHNQQYYNTKSSKDEFHHHGYSQTRKANEVNVQHYYVKIPKEEYYKQEHGKKFQEKDVHNQNTNTQNTRSNTNRSHPNQSFKKRSRSKPIVNGNKSVVDASGNSKINSTKKSSAFDDEYIDDTLEDLEQYRLKVDMEDFIVIDPESPDPILAMPLKPWSNTDIMDSIEVNKIDGEAQSNELSSHILNCVNERAREYFNLICQNPLDVSCSNPDVDDGLNLHEKNLTNIQANSQLENEASKVLNEEEVREEESNEANETTNADGVSSVKGLNIENIDDIKIAEKEVEAIEKEIKSSTAEIELVEQKFQNSQSIAEEKELINDVNKEKETEEIPNGNKDEIEEDNININEKEQVVENTDGDKEKIVEENANENEVKIVEEINMTNNVNASEVENNREADCNPLDQSQHVKEKEQTADTINEHVAVEVGSAREIISNPDTAAVL